MRTKSQKQELLGTLINIKLPTSFTSYFSLCFNEIKRIEETYSRFIDSSALSKLNNNLNSWQKISNEFYYLIAKGLEYNKITNGKFDITLKNTLDSIGYDKNYSLIAKKSLLKKSIVNNVSSPIKLRQNKVYLKKEIELGGFGKGYAIDRVAQVLNSKNVNHYFINAGGDIFAKSNIEPWKIELENPIDTSRVIGNIKINNSALTSSAANRRKWGEMHHLIDSKTNKPANDIVGVHVKSDKAIDADAYATALFCSTFEDSIKMANNLKIEALIISNKKKIFRTRGMNIEFYK